NFFEAVPFVLMFLHHHLNRIFHRLKMRRIHTGQTVFGFFDHFPDVWKQDQFLFLHMRSKLSSPFTEQFSDLIQLRMHITVYFTEFVEVLEQKWDSLLYVPVVLLLDIISQEIERPE